MQHKKNVKHPILLLEINEVPWRVIDTFKNNPRFPNIKKFFEVAQTRTTLTVDKGELSPWIIWPTLHRGVDAEVHGIQVLGQDPETYRGTAIWEEYLRAGYNVGVCGSLQSWPPQNPGDSGFYLPDTFSHDEKCFPRHLQPLVKFNLGQVRRNGRVLAKNSFFNRDLIDLVKGIAKYGISVRTFLAIAKQLIAEKFDRSLIERRRIFQSIIFWDVFKSLYNRLNPPAFSTFFTNHIAGVMHRYWHHLYPNDFKGKYSAENPVHYETMLFALDLLDQILKEAMLFARQNPDLRVVFASGMGQEHVFRDRHEGLELSIRSVMDLLACCEITKKEVSPLLAMVPQVAAEFKDLKALEKAKSCLASAKTKSGEDLFKLEAHGKSLSITIITPVKSDINAGSFKMNGKDYSWSDAAIQVTEIEAGTAYHIPEGVMAVVGVGVKADDSRTQMIATDFKKYLMDLSGGVFTSERAKSEKLVSTL